MIRISILLYSMMVNRLLALGVLIPTLILTAPNVYARNLSDTQRYNDGYSNGAQAAAADSTYNPTCDPTGAYTSGGGHTPTYCSGWANGYTATWNANHVAAAGGIQPAQPTPQPGIAVAQNTTSSPTSASFPGRDFGDLSDLSNIPLIGGFIASKSVPTGILHNEYGIFVPWSKICAAGQQLLQQDCSQLVDQSTGALTSDGDKAVSCIRNGALIAALAEKHGINAPTVLGLAAPIFGCGGIADLNQMNSSPYIQSILNLVEPYMP
jgi:hypothetical protein